MIVRTAAEGKNTAELHEDLTDLFAYSEQSSVMVARRNERYADWHSILAFEPWNVYYWCMQCLHAY